MATFRVRARTVDMLGRQQIAGIPTAISELFKNAHDAYAKAVEVDYFREERLFVLRDDGLGMTKEDFEQRWLTLGTESKLGTASLAPPPRDPDQPKRPYLGEKGIGRLAVAIIGPQAFLLSRAKRNGVPATTVVAAYINWTMFELPGLDLSEIVIPIREFKGRLPNGADVKGMISEALQSIEKLRDRLPATRLRELQRQMVGFDLDPAKWQQILGNPTLHDDGVGTHFFIQPVDTILGDDIDNRQGEGKATRFERHLIGFTNTMVEKPKPPIIAKFRDHKNEGPAAELIGDTAFFTPAEFTEVDHHFTGEFDAYGQFRGTAGIYQMKEEEYVLSWHESDGTPTQCGPFSLSFAYMQGQARDSLVPPEEHTRMRRKLDRIGGLYIYRDGIRVQPYGDSDFDWLDIERNRTLGAGYYFYSYRRIFGFIGLKQGMNDALSEKAGREGFRDNIAYRQLRSILMNFFQQTAGDFFRETGRYSEKHFEKKGELNRNEDIRRRQALKVRVKRTAFQDSLAQAFSSFDDGQPEREIKAAVADVKRETDKVIKQKAPAQQKALALMRIEKTGRDRIDEIKRSVIVTKPRGVGLSRGLNNEWASYQTYVEQLREDLLDPAENEIEEYISNAASHSKISLNDAARLTSVISEVGEGALKSTRNLRNEVSALTTELATKVRDLTRESFSTVSHAVDEAVAEIEKLQRSSARLKNLAAERDRLRKTISEAFNTEKKKLERLRDQLNEVARVWQEGEYDTAELTEAIEEELDELRERRDADLELAQIGLALNSVSHEFDKTVSNIRDGIGRLGSWAAENPDLRSLHHLLEISFAHLDEYLSLFTQLDRRTHSRKIRISGKEIFEFLQRLFGTRLERHHIQLVATKQFIQKAVNGYPSAIYPSFVNLVDNSIYWLQRQRTDRIITLASEGTDFLVFDNGPGISSRDRDNIFALNFSRKPGGRGMGLHITREALAKAGFQLSLDNNRDVKGAHFRISPVEVSREGRRGSK